MTVPDACETSLYSVNMASLEPDACNCQARTVRVPNLHRMRAGAKLTPDVGSIVPESRQTRAGRVQIPTRAGRVRCRTRAGLIVFRA